MLKKLIYGLGSVCLLASAQATTLTPVQNVGALSTLAANDGDLVTATGYTTAGDGGGGDFVWSGSSTVTADFGLVFTGTSGTSTAGRWLRTTTDVDVRMFGAKGDGVTNDRLAIQAAIDSAINNGYPAVHLGGGRRYYVKDSSLVTIPNRPPGGGFPNRGILTAGFESSANGKRFSLLGDGSTLYTDEERGGASYSPQENGLSPDVLCVLTRLAAFSVQDLTIERSITGGRTDAPLNSSLSTDDRPNGFNRSGITVFSYNESPVEGVTIRNVTFIDCHRALNFDDPRSLGDYYGKLQNVVVDGCKFLYPYGGNIYHDSQSSPGAYTATLFTNWINTLAVTNCTYDGAVGDNLGTTLYSLPPDGFIMAAPSPKQSVVSGNTLQHFAYEAVLFDSGPNVNAVHSIQFTMPAVGGTTPWIAATGTLGSEIQVSGTLYIGPSKPIVGSVPLGYTGTNGQVVFTGTSDATGFMAVAEISSDRLSFKLRNDGDSYNPAPGVTVALADQTWMYKPDQVAGANVVISNNTFGTPFVSTGMRGSELGVLVADLQCVISNNIFTNTSIAIKLFENYLSQGGMANSLVEGNIIKIYDTTLPNQSYAGGISSFANSTVIRNNSIQTPHSSGVTGIAVFTSNCQIVGNSILAFKHDSSDTSSSGIFTQYGDNEYIEGNTTQNFYYGIHINSFDNNGNPESGTIVNHTSTGDVVGVVPAGFVYQNQSLAVTATAAGWYKIEEDWSQNAFALKLSIAHWSMSADVETTFDTYGIVRNIIQEDFISRDTPIVDKIATDSAAGPHSIWLHVTGSSSTPIRIQMETTNPGVCLLTTGTLDPSMPPTSPSSTYRCLTFSTNGVKSLTGMGILNNPSGGPTGTTPEFLGQELLWNGQLYLASGTTSADWKPLASLGSNANFASLLATSGSFTTLTGTTASFGSLSAASGNFTSLTSGTATLSYIASSGTLGLGINGQLIASVQSGGISLNQGAFDATAGSATAPGYSFNSDGDTGIYLATANPSSLGIALDGTDAMVISGSGTVVNGSVTTSKFVVSGSTPTIAGGPGAGTTGRSLTLDSNSTDAAGQINITTGASPATWSVIATVTFSHPYDVPPIIVIGPTNGNSAGIPTPAAVRLSGNTGFQVIVGASALAGSGASYKYSYIVVQPSH